MLFDERSHFTRRDGYLLVVFCLALIGGFYFKQWVEEVPLTTLTRYSCEELGGQFTGLEYQRAKYGRLLSYGGCTVQGAHTRLGIFSQTQFIDSVFHFFYQIIFSPFAVVFTLLLFYGKLKKGVL